MDVVEFTPSPGEYAFTFGGVAPVRRVKAGTVLRLWSEDAFGGVLRTTSDLSSDKVDLRFVNPQTGPFYVEGAQPGDTLALHLVSVEPARDWGASATIPFFGGLTGTDRTATLQDPLPAPPCQTRPGSTPSTAPGERWGSRRGTAPFGSTCRSSRCWARWGWRRR